MLWNQHLRKRCVTCTDLCMSSLSLHSELIGPINSWFMNRPALPPHPCLRAGYLLQQQAATRLLHLIVSSAHSRREGQTSWDTVPQRHWYTCSASHPQVYLPSFSLTLCCFTRGRRLGVAWWSGRTLWLIIEKKREDDKWPCNLKERGGKEQPEAASFFLLLLLITFLLHSFLFARVLIQDWYCMCCTQCV